MMTAETVWELDCPGQLVTELVDDVVQVTCYVEEGPLPPPGTRVTEGLRLLYTFHEGEGTTVHDVSEVGEPLDLTLASKSAAKWLPSGGLSVDSPTSISSAVPAGKVIKAARASNEITIEAWLKPADITLDAPPRIVTLSADYHHANLQLIQAGNIYDARLRTTETTLSGRPSLATPSGSLTADLTHVVYTRAASGLARFYIDGEKLVGKAIGGDFANWDADYHLALANELTGSRAWLGEYHLVAVYGRALRATEVKQNYDAGIESVPEPPEPPLPGDPPTITSTPQTAATVGKLYTYDVEASGDPRPTYRLIASPTGMTINGESGSIRWTPTVDQVGSNDVTVVARNGVEPNARQSFAVEVSKPPVPPPAGKVTDYGGSHISKASSLYKVRVNGEPVFVHFFEGHNPEAGQTGGFLHYAHFAFDGTANIEVEYKDNITQHYLSPRRHQITPEINGKTMKFSISEPRKLVIGINQPLPKTNMDMMHHLALFAEAPEVDVPDRNAANVRVVTSASQAQSAINGCPDGGVVYFPSGTYGLSSSLSVKSNITIYLEGGAFIVLDGSDPFSIIDKQNVTIRGRGVIQSFGRTLHPTRVNNLHIDGVVLRNRRAGYYGHWAFKPGKTHNSVIRNVKLMVAPRVGGRALDGIDPSNVKNLLIEDCFVLSGDDAMCIKTMGAPEKGDHPYSDGPNEEIENLVIRKCVLFTHASAVKTGSEVYRKVKSLVWEDNDVVFGHVIFCSRARGSNAGLNTEVNGLHLDNCAGRILEAGWRPYDVTISGQVDIVVNDMVIHHVWPGTNCLWVTGDSSSRINITFNNLKVLGNYIHSRQELEATGISVSIQAGGGTVNLKFNVTQ
jgi:hypothetical protein